MHGQGCPGCTSRKRDTRGVCESGSSILAQLQQIFQAWLRRQCRGVLDNFFIFLALGALLLDTHVNCLPDTNWIPQLWHVLRSLLQPSRSQNMSSHIWLNPSSTPAFPVAGPHSQLRMFLLSFPSLQWHYTSLHTASLSLSKVQNGVSTPCAAHDPRVFAHCGECDLILSESLCLPWPTTVAPPLSLPTSRAGIFWIAFLPHGGIPLTTIPAPATHTLGAFTPPEASRV